MLRAAIDLARRQIRPQTWLLVALPFVAAAVVWAIFGFAHVSDDARQAQTLFAQLESDTNRLNALEWEGRMEEGPDSEIFGEYALVRRDAAARFESLMVVDSDDENPVVIAALFNSYADTIGAQLDLLRAGRLADAEAVAARLTDPAHDVLKRRLAEVIEEEDREAAMASRAVRVGTAGSIALAAISFMLLFAHFDRASRRRQRRRVAELGHQAEHDALTGLGNRRKLMRDLARRLQVTSETAHLVMFDLDGFKAYNDTFGHPEGDVLLQRLGQRLVGAVGSFGHAYRLGGDEFCVLFDAQVDFGVAIERCTQALTDAGEGFQVGTSRGSVRIPAEAAEPAGALRIADERMYAHKGGRRASTRQQTRGLVLRVLAEQRPDLHDHARGVADLARAVGSRMRLGEVDLGDLVRSAELHDVGKVAIPDAIVHKLGPLDEREWAFMRRHTIIGESMLSAAPALASVAALVRSSHERFDGGGYPDGLAGEQIPLASRIVFVCDSFDAMTSDRPYRSGMGEEWALAELRRCAGQQFDPGVVEAFCAVMAEAGTNDLERPPLVAGQTAQA